MAWNRASNWMPSLMLATAMTILAASPTIAVPSKPHYIAVDGVIEDMWLGEGQCWFSVEIEWANNSEIIGKDIDCSVTYLNYSSGRYETIRSSQGWQIGDRLNCTVVHQWDEYSEWYNIKTISKSDVNYASKPEHDGVVTIIFAAAFALAALLVVLAILVWYRKKHK